MSYLTMPAEGRYGSYRNYKKIIKKEGNYDETF